MNELYSLLSPSVILKLEPKRSVLIDLGRNGETRFINESASIILSSSDGEKSLSEIGAILAKEYDGSAEDGRNLAEKFLKTSAENGHVLLLKQPAKKQIRVTGTREYPTPISASLEVTMRCNLKCRHCYAEAGAPKGRELDTTHMKGIMDKLKRSGVLRLTFTGGETLLREDIFELLEYSSKMFSTQLMTNGTLITPKIAEKIAGLRVPVQISIDGSKAETHDFIRDVPGSFESALHGVRMLSKKGVFVILAMLATPFNLREIEDTVKLAIGSGAKGFRLGALTTVGRAKDLGWSLTLEQFEKSQRIMESVHLKYKDKIWIQTGESGITGDEAPHDESAPAGNCGAGHLNVAISPEGVVRPCIIGADSAMEIGNIDTMEPEQIWKSAKVKFYSEIKAPNRSICGDCKELVFCNGCFLKGHVSKESGIDCRWHGSEMAGKSMD